ncbi:hypothetical protein LguiA_034840 [Lonicera macranthoides]
MGLFMWLYLYLLFTSQLQFAYSKKLTPNSSPNHLCPDDQSLALLHFKQNFTIDTSASQRCDYLGQSPRPKTVSWNTSTDCCTWDGVTCHGRTGHVIGLDLSCSQLQGTINPNSTLFNLSHLKRLNLAHNNFYPSQISLEFGRFASTLTHLNLSSSSFSGQIASQILTLSKLVSLDLSRDFSDNGNLSIAPRIFRLLLLNLTRLTEISLSNVNISSVFPMNLSSSLKFLDLSSTGLHGALPDSISNIKSLNHLRLSDCEFSGSIPESIGNLTQISVLDLSYSNFSGEFPSTISKLELLSHLDISNNKLQGHIPNVFAKLRNMSYLSLQGNNFNGPLPSSIANLTQLVHLDLSSNSITGSIPSWLFALPSLVHLNAQSNRLTGQLEEFQYQSLEDIFLNNNELNGPIPRSIAKLVNLTSLYLAGNQLTGIVELEMFSKLTRLQALHLSNNSLSVSATNTNINTTMPNLFVLSLSSCNLKEFPDLLRDSVDLRVLDLSYNQIRGKIPNWVRVKWRDSWSYIGILDLRSNFLQGSLPSSICNLNTLEVLALSNNSFNGAIPQCLGNFSDRLAILDLRGNRFSGAIPTIFEGKRLRNLNLHDNQLQGTLPRTLAKCSELEVFDVGNNQINDTFPQWLEILPNLEVLVLRYNRFYGSVDTNSSTEIPFAKLRIIDLSHNEFTGLLPSKYFRSFHAMADVGENEMDQQYMQTTYEDYFYYINVVIKYQETELMRILTVFIAIDMSDNKFEGEISSFIGNLNSLRALNLSHNNLVGRIPSVFGNLSVLESLDLSSNQLTGEIPQQLTGINFLAVLNLSQNHLVGRIPRGPQFNTFQSISYVGNSALCGFPLSNTCGENKTPQPYVPQQEDDSDFASGFTWKVVLMGYGSGTVFGLVMGYLMFLTEKPKGFIRLVESVTFKNTRRPTKRGRIRHGRRT